MSGRDGIDPHIKLADSARRCANALHGWLTSIPNQTLWYGQKPEWRVFQCAESCDSIRDGLSDITSHVKGLLCEIRNAGKERAIGDLIAKCQVEEYLETAKSTIDAIEFFEAKYVHELARDDLKSRDLVRVVREHGKQIIAMMICSEGNWATLMQACRRIRGMSDELMAIATSTENDMTSELALLGRLADRPSWRMYELPLCITQEQIRRWDESRDIEVRLWGREESRFKALVDPLYDQIGPMKYCSNWFSPKYDPLIATGWDSIESNHPFDGERAPEIRITAEGHRRVNRYLDALAVQSVTLPAPHSGKQEHHANELPTVRIEQHRSDVGFERCGPKGTRLILDEASLSVRVGDRVFRFPESRRNHFRIFERITRRPGIPVMLDTFVDERYWDDPIDPGAFGQRFKQIRKSLRDGKLDDVAKCVRCFESNPPRAVYELSK